jgi:hypothetical protein
MMSIRTVAALLLFLSSIAIADPANFFLFPADSIDTTNEDPSQNPVFLLDARKCSSGQQMWQLPASLYSRMAPPADFFFFV